MVSEIISDYPLGAVAKALIGTFYHLYASSGD